ncbi:MAG TPA: hypothetical protein VMZ28_26165 [Kofleriaceae bacterium]|nr:hypothetical protein [Kofleriaceae bacterium]
MHERILRGTRILVLALGAALAACGGGGGGGGGDDDAEADAGPGDGDTHTVGGTVTGLYGTVELENNGGDRLTLTESGAFEFTTALEEGADYDVTIESQAGAVCSVAQGSGTVGGADVDDVAVTCVELIAFISTMALDGSDAINDNFTNNVWVVAPDGSHLAPLTELTEVGPGTFGVQWSPDGTRLMFTSIRALSGDDEAGAVNNVWVMNADGTALEALTNQTAAGSDCHGVQWSPDGGRILFRSRRALDGSDEAGTADNLWVMNADGSDPSPVTENTTASTGENATWSPDGTRIAYQSSEALGAPDTVGSQTNIWVIALDGSVPRATLTHGTVTASYEPVWSPDGSRIAFTSDRAVNGADEVNNGSNTNIWVTRPDGTHTRAITALTEATSLTPSWSADGERVVYRSKRTLDGEDASIGATNIWATDVDGDNAQALTQLTLSNNLNARSSPDGTLIVYESARSLDGEDAANDNLTRNLWMMTAGGDDHTPLTMGTASQAGSYTPVWVP